MNQLHAKESQVAFVTAIVVVLSVAAPAAAEVQLPGDGPNALPAVYRIGVVDDEQHRLTFSGFVGYGFTEGVLGEDDKHHRVPMALSLSYRPLSWLAFGYTQDIRYDAHSGPPNDGDDGWILEPRMRLRGGWVSDFGLRLGAELAIWLPASDSQGSPGEGASVDMTALVAYQPGDRPLIIAMHVGFRLDRSAEGTTNADALSRSDRLALGVSDSNAVIIGAGMVYAVGPMELLGEWTWDLNVGDGAPDVGSSPMRLTVGARYWPLRSLQVSLLADIGLSGRPLVDQGEPLVAVEPRVTIMAGVTYRLGFVDETEALATSSTLAGIIVETGGDAIAGAQVRIEGRRLSQEAVTDEAGRFELPRPRRGELTLSVSAEGYTSNEVTQTVEALGEEPLRVELEPLPSYLRGRVVTGENTPVGDAAVLMVCGEREIEIASDAEGAFSFEELPACSFELTVRSPGYRTRTVNDELARGQTTELEVQIDAGLPEGQLQGTVRSIDGTPLRAFVLVVGRREPIRAAENGTFEISLPPERYQVRIGLRGFTEERRTVVIEENGVVMLNVDLRPARRRRR